MINKIRSILSDTVFQFQIQGEKVTFYKDFPEDCVVLVYKDSRYIVEEVHRDSKKIVARAFSENELIYHIVAILDNFFNTKRDMETPRKIRNLVRDGKFDEVEKLFEPIKNTTLQIIISEEDNNEKLCSLSYGDTILLNNLSIQRAYVTLYNYTMKINRVTEIYDRTKNIVGEECIDLKQFLSHYINVN